MIPIVLDSTWANTLSSGSTLDVTGSGWIMLAGWRDGCQGNSYTKNDNNDDSSIQYWEKKSMYVKSIIRQLLSVHIHNDSGVFQCACCVPNANLFHCHRIGNNR